MTSRLPSFLLYAFCVLWTINPGIGTFAQQPESTGAGSSEGLTSPTGPKPEGEAVQPNRRAGPISAVREALAEKGMTFGAIYTGEVFGNPVGGVRQGVVYDGLLELDLDIDFEKLAHLPGFKLHANAFELHGPSGTDKYVGDFGTFSNIDFYDSFRLFELWLQQDLTIPRFGKLSLRIGQLASDKEFYGSELSALYINSSFGVLPTISGNMPTPIFAIAAPGLRLRWEPSDSFYLMAAVYDGNPDPDTLGDPSPDSRPGTTYNHTGARINLNSSEGTYALGEVGYLLNQGRDARGLPGSYKIGGWYHSDTFSDGRYDNTGRSLANPSSTGVPEEHSGNFGGYLVIDQALYRPRELAGPEDKEASGGKNSAAAAQESESPSGALPGRGMAAFLRVSAAPGDRNTVSFYLDTGFNYRGLIPGREKDLLGVAVNYVRFSDSRRKLDRDSSFFSGVSLPDRDQEIVLEATYQAIISSWCAVQPDLQAILHPGGSEATDDAIVLGVRTVLTF